MHGIQLRGNGATSKSSFIQCDSEYSSIFSREIFHSSPGSMRYLGFVFKTKRSSQREGTQSDAF